MKKIKNKEIKDFMQLMSLTNEDMAHFYNMPYNSFTNKLNQRDFKLSEIIKLLESKNCKLAILNQDNIPIINFKKEENDN